MNRIVAIQMASGPNVGANLIEVERLLARAVESGAKLVVLPENFAVMGMSEADKVKAGEPEGSGPMQDFLSRMAKQHGIWIVGGTIPLKTAGAGKVSASCLVYDSAGEVKARYDKIHLFDVQIEGSGEEYTESAIIEPGRGVTVVDTPVGRLGLAICYDLRFPELFRSMLDLGAEIIALPSAFTAYTGKAHWESLIRARAIENQCYLVASAQGGYHLNGRETYGHSMIVDPWGTILDELDNGAGIVGAEIDLKLVRRIRERFPSISHRRWQTLSKDN
ncbi:MAG: carbon-nitrogen hydrolase family protein [Gammaproteobacteria bacterium]|nr:carbon-nitrogen hydrolase family protein [Gammaproteobacteria bacterium]